LPGVESGSNWSASLTCATLVKMAKTSTDAVICSEVLDPTARSPIVQRAVLVS